MTFSEQLQADIMQIESALIRYLSCETGEGYDRIFEAVKYSTMAGGKRLRPVILLEFCRMCGGDVKQALPFACALEMIHTYSLIHDDLPCMDNDDLRRGRPTNHKVFGEAIAVLSGDGLLTRAFDVASENANGLPPETVLRCIRRLSNAAGMSGMVGGQVLDIESEHQKLSLDALKLLQNLKTGCLIRAACEVGCIVAHRDDPQTLTTAQTYGEKLGLAFQIRDDILDIEGNTTTLGKSIGKDVKNEKSTFPSLIGLPQCRAMVHELTSEAVDAISGYENHDFLTALAYSLIGREN